LTALRATDDASKPAAQRIEAAVEGMVTAYLARLKDD